MTVPHTLPHRGTVSGGLQEAKKGRFSPVLWTITEQPWRLFFDPQGDRSTWQLDYRVTKQRGLIKALMAAGLTQTSRGWHIDELRVGRWGQIRRHWGRQGVKIGHPKQIVFAWQYLVLAGDVVPVFAAWTFDAAIWDGAAAHRGKRMGALPFERIALPP